MKCLLLFAAVVCVARAAVIPAAVQVAAPTHLVRTPAFDSAVIKSDRLGGNFAYSTAENHAYAAVSPVIQHVATPVAVSYSAPALTYHHPLTYTAVAAPAFAVAQAPAIAAVAHPVAVGPAPVITATAPVLAAPAAVAAVEEAAPIPAEVPAASAPLPVEAPAAPQAPASDDTVAVEAA